MAISKLAFYEGAALHILIRSGDVQNIRYKPPFFTLNDRLVILVKYSTKTSTPWGFTFTPEEQLSLHHKTRAHLVIIGLVCGADGVAALPYDAFAEVAAISALAIHISCYRLHGEHYGISGPEGILGAKIAPSSWQRLLRDH